MVPPAVTEKEVPTFEYYTTESFGNVVPTASLTVVDNYDIEPVLEPPKEPVETQNDVSFSDPFFNSYFKRQ